MRARPGLIFNRQRYLRAANLIGSTALLVRAVTLPPSWVFDEPALSRSPDFRKSGKPSSRYRLIRRLGIGSAVLDIALTQRISARTTLLLLCCERLTATRLAGFVPYVDHLYVYAGYIRLATLIGEPRPDSRHPHPVALLPATIYLASATAKLRNGAESWLSTGDILDNALDLYGWNRTAHWVRPLDRVMLSRAALAFELLALPVSIAGPQGMRAISVLGLAFHATNYAAMRISFWHLAFMHLPALYALGRKSDR